MRINILGTEYTITELLRHEDEKLSENDGYCDNYSKEIVVLKDVAPHPMNVADLEAAKNKVIRHELIHAFLFESGLAENSEWGQDETLVDWMAIQIPKIVNAMKEVEAL